jgi:hypothetical protein
VPPRTPRSFGWGVNSGPKTGSWLKIGGMLTDAPTAAGTREPAPHMIVGVIGADHALWTTTGGLSNTFTRAWAPVG